MSSRNTQSPATIAARLGGFVDGESGGVVPPIQPSTTFVRNENYELVNPQNSYGRDDNDQVRLAEDVLSRLDNGDDSLLFSSGMAAIACLVSSLKRGEKLFLQSGIYWGTTAHLRRFASHREVCLVECDVTQAETFCHRVFSEKPAMVFLEVPSNPWLRVCDVRRIAEACRASGVVLAVDATAATPLLFRPLEHGADVVVHSATKAINGHSDVLAGVLTCAERNSELWQFVKQERAGAGAILSAHSAWLLLRGMRTLPLRVERMCENAMSVAGFLNEQSIVDEVWYPGLEDHQDHSVAQQLMTGGYGYLMSFLLKGGKEEALKFCSALRGIERATSLGGTESLVEHRHTIEGEMTGCPDNLIRLTVGIENPDDLKSELGEALSNL